MCMTSEVSMMQSYSPPYPPSLFPFPLPTLSVYVTHSFHSFPFSLSLQERGHTALTIASWKGHTEIIKLLLAVPGIDVNHADVSLYLLTLSHLVVGDMCEAPLPDLISHPNSRNRDLSPPNA